MQEFFLLLTGAYGNSAPLDRRVDKYRSREQYEPWHLADPFPYRPDINNFLKAFGLCEGVVFSANRVSTIAIHWQMCETSLQNVTKDAKVHVRDQYIKWIDALVFAIARAFKDMVESLDLLAECSRILPVKGTVPPIYMTPPWMEEIRSDFHMIIHILKKMFTDMKEMGIQTSCDAHHIANLLMHGEVCDITLTTSLMNGVDLVNQLTTVEHYHNNSIPEFDQVLQIEMLELLPSALQFVITCRGVPALPQSGQGSMVIMAGPSGDCPFAMMPSSVFMILFKDMHLKDTLNLASTCHRLRYLYADHATKRRASVLPYATCLVNKCNEVASKLFSCYASM